LKQNGIVVSSTSLQNALKEFIMYLRPARKVLLVAHNALFNMKFIIVALLDYPDLLLEFLDIVEGAADTLALVRHLYPIKKNIPQNHGLANHKLGTVAKFVLGQSYSFDAHNALGDVRALRDLVSTKIETREYQSFAIQLYCNKYCKEFTKTKSRKRFQIIELFCDVSKPSPVLDSNFGGLLRGYKK
jgi:DNA polymerase III alpha subunit (gram-positive type)